MVMLVILNATFMVPVHAAFVGPVVVDATVAISSALGALGVGISGAVSNADWKGMIDSIGGKISQDIMGGVTANQVGNAIQYHLTHDFLKSVSMSFNDYITSAQKTSDLVNEFGSSAKLEQTNMSSPMTLQQIYNAIGCPWSQSGDFQYSDFGGASGTDFKVDSYAILDKCYWSTAADFVISSKSWFTLNGKKYAMIIPYYSEMIEIASDNSYTYIQGSSNYTFYPMVHPTSLSRVWLAGYVLGVHPVGHSHWEYYVINTAGVPSNLRLGVYENITPINVYSDVKPATNTDNAKIVPKIYANGNSVLPKTGDKTAAADAVIGALEGTKVGHKTDAGTKDGIDVQVPSNANTANPSNLRDATGTQTKVVGQDVATEADKAADDTYNQTNSKDTTPPKSTSMPSLELPTGLQKKFPFCLPWDLAAIYKLFNVTPKAPVWTIPVNIDQGFLHVHQTYTYDLNQNNVLDKGLPIFKWFLNISFCIGLIFITKRIMT